MKKALYPSGEHVLHIAKFYASVAIAGIGAMILIAAIIADPLLVPAVLVGFFCAHHQKEIIDAAKAFWRNLCDQHPLSKT